MTDAHQPIASASKVASLDWLQKRIRAFFAADQLASRIAFAVILAAVAWLYVSLISARGQYPLYKDEEFIAKPAWHMVQDGTLKPGFYRYGSLPLYLAAGAMKLGVSLLLQAGLIQSSLDVSSVGFPYYSHASLMFWPRSLFALFGVLGMAACGLAARAYGRSSLLWLAPLALCSSSWYLNQSWGYLNVDIVVTGIAMCGLAYLAYTHQRTSYLHRVWIPALFCGAACATKYNNLVLMAPFALASLRRHDLKRSVYQLGLLLLATGLVFLVLEPYSVIDREKFIADVQFEVAHYTRGHAGHDSEPGLPQLQFYFGELYKDFGPVLCALAAFGIARGFATEPRLTSFLLAYPAALLLLMCSYRVHFTRAILPLFPVLATCVAVGFSSILEVLFAPWKTRIPGTLKLVAGIVLGALVVFSSPTERVRFQSRVIVDSRIVATRWLTEHVSAPCTLIVPEKLAIDLRQSSCKVRTIGRVDRELPPLVDSIRSGPPTVGRTLLLFSEWGHLAHRRGGQAVAERWNASLTSLGSHGLLFKAGATPVWVNYPSVEKGDPVLAIYEVQ